MQISKTLCCGSLMSTANLLTASKIGYYGIYQSTEKNSPGSVGAPAKERRP